MPAYNSGEFISEAINSVLQQTYQNWELIIVNDGSTDNTETITHSFNDPRIIVFSQQNRGVSSARNLGLQKITGEYFCFLDADDIFPPNSINSRINHFIENPRLTFVDGRVISKNKDLSLTLSIYTPSFKGQPLKELLRLSNSCILGNTWMIKKERNVNYLFTPGLTHSEDLSFYLAICANKDYDFVDNEILWYRRTTSSAMNNLKGLENGYLHILKQAKKIELTSKKDLYYLKTRIIRIMFLSWLINGKNPMQAIKSFFRITFE